MGISINSIDLSLNNNFYNKSTINTTLGTYLLKTDFDASLNTNYYNRPSVDAAFYNKTTIDASMNDNFYNKTTIDASLNSNFYNKTTMNTTLNTYLTKTNFDSSLNSNYYNKSRIDSSINSVLLNYSTTSYVDGRFTTLTGVAPYQLDTLAEIADALRGDASFGMTVYTKIASSDLSINNIRTNLSNYVLTNDSSVNTIKTNFSEYVLAIDASLSAIRTSIQQVSSTGSVQDPSINDLILYNSNQDTSINTIRTTVSGFSTTYYTKTTIDASINDNFYNKTTSNSRFLGKSDFDASMSSNYYNKTTIDASINDNVYNKTTIDTSINNVLLNYSQGIKYQVTNSGSGAYVINGVDNQTLTLIRGLTYILSINASGHPFWIQTSQGAYNDSNIYNTGITNNGTQNGNITWVISNDAPNTLYYVCEYHSTMKGRINIIDLSFATPSLLTSYYTKTDIDASVNNNVYNKTTIDSSINSVLSNYAQASSLTAYYTKTNIDASINSILTTTYSTQSYVNDRFTTLIGTVSTDKLDTLAEIANALRGDASFGMTVYQRIDAADSSINTIRTSLANYALTSTVDASLALYSTKSVIDASLALYSTKSVIDASLSSYATTSSLAGYASLTSDASFAGNVQIGTTSTRSIGINKAPSTAFALDVSGSTNMSGNLTLAKRTTDISYAYFDLSSVNMSIFNVAEKFTIVPLGGTPILDYSTGGIFYMANVNAALTAISITNVPTTLNRSISVTLILAQNNGAGTNCFTTGTLNVNGTGITYLKPDATALAAPSANRAVIINQFIIIWVSATPTVIAYLSSMG